MHKNRPEAQPQEAFDSPGEREEVAQAHALRHNGREVAQLHKPLVVNG